MVDAYVNESKSNDSLENNDERTTRRERSKLIYSSKTFARNTTVCAVEKKRTKESKIDQERKRDRRRTEKEEQEDPKREIQPDSGGRGRYIYKLASVSLESCDLVATEGDRRVRFKRLFSRPHSRETAFCRVKMLQSNIPSIISKMDSGIIGQVVKHF